MAHSAPASASYSTRAPLRPHDRVGIVPYLATEKLPDSSDPSAMPARIARAPCRIRRLGTPSSPAGTPPPHPIAPTPEAPPPSPPPAAPSPQAFASSFSWGILNVRMLSGGQTDPPQIVRL